MKKAVVPKCDSGQIVFYKAEGAKVFENRLILAHVDNDEYISLSPAGGGEIVLEDFGVKGSSLEVSDPDRPGIPPTVMKGLVEFEEMPSQSDFEDLVERADAMAGESKESKAAALADDQDGLPTSGSKRPLADYTAPASRALPGLQKPEVVKPPNLHADGSKGGLSGGLGALASALGKNIVEYPQEAGANSDNDESSDVRTLPVLYDRQGQRFREFRQAVSQCEHHTFPDWPIPGPATVMWVIKWMVARGEPLLLGMLLGRQMVDYKIRRPPSCIMSQIAGSLKPLFAMTK